MFLVISLSFFCFFVYEKITFGSLLKFNERKNAKRKKGAKNENRVAQQG